LRVREKKIIKKNPKNSIHRRYLDPDLPLEKVLDPDPHCINADPETLETVI
jgi:hypothetical protein